MPIRVFTNDTKVHHVPIGDTGPVRVLADNSIPVSSRLFVFDLADAITGVLDAQAGNAFTIIVDFAGQQEVGAITVTDEIQAADLLVRLGELRLEAEETFREIEVVLRPLDTIDAVQACTVSVRLLPVRVYDRMIPVEVAADFRPLDVVEGGQVDQLVNDPLEPR
jgi:hypothetical protein